MVILFGLPGSNHFAICGGLTKSEALAKLEELRGPEHMRTQASENAYRQSQIISEKEAKTLRWRSGYKMYQPYMIDT